MGQKIRRLQLMGHVKIIQMFCRWSSLVSKNQESCFFPKHTFFILSTKTKRNLKILYLHFKIFFIIYHKSSCYCDYLVGICSYNTRCLCFLRLRQIYINYRRNCILLQPYANETKFNHKSSPLSNSLLTFGIANFFNFNLSFYISGNETSHMCLSEGIHFQFVLMKSI